MKIRYLLIIPLLIIFTFGKAISAEIEWLSQYERAIEKSQQQQKPIILFFTRSDWCHWCQKLENDTFNTDEFAQVVGNKLLFLKLDFPMREQLEDQLHAQNEQLKVKFGVNSFPTVILLDHHGQRIGFTGYQPGSPRKYAEHLLDIIDEYNQFTVQVNQLKDHDFNGKDLKRMYQKAKELDLIAEARLIQKIGIYSDQSQYFLTEKYRDLVEEGKIHDEDASNLRQKLLMNDPDNIELTHYQVAVIDFEAYCEEMEREKYAPELAVQPLVDYIATFGRKDPENLWRLQMVISQVYLEKNNFAKALKYAESSYLTAPLSIQQDIAQAIENIRHYQNAEQAQAYLN